MAVLSQLADGDDVARPIAFASKSLNYAQSRYPAHRLEFLALEWAVCDKFCHWLRGHQFTVWTDNNPLRGGCQNWPRTTLTSDTFLVLKMWWQMPSAMSLLCAPVFSIDSRHSPMVHSWRK